MKLSLNGVVPFAILDGSLTMLRCRSFWSDHLMQPIAPTRRISWLP